MEATRTYFKVMYKGSSGLIPLCIINQPQDKKQKPSLQVRGFYDVTQLPSLLAEAERLNGNYHIYTGIHPLRERPSEGRGKEKDIFGIALFAADVDAKDFIDDPVEKQKADEERAFYRWTDELLSECKAKALTHINSVCERVSLPPTAIIDSGHGYYPIFKLDKFVEFERNQHREELKKLNKTLHELLSADSTFDFARILRVPGTRNIKPGFPADCKLLEFHPDRRYSLDDIRRFEKLIEISLDAVVPIASEASQLSPLEKPSILQNHKGASHPGIGEPKPPVVSLDDQALIAKAKSAKGGAKFTALWEGDISGYENNHSDADLALCCMLAFWTCGDRNRIESLFRQSSLYREDKWGSREDYRERTINAALEQVKVFYDPKPERRPRLKDNKIRDGKRVHHLLFLAKRYRQQGTKRSEILLLLNEENQSKCEPCLSEPEVEDLVNKLLPKLKTISAAELLDMDLPVPKWAIPDFVPEGLTILAGRPKVGKSWMALSFCAAIALGGYALGKIQVEQGETLYIGLEDNYRRLQDRLFQLCEGAKPSNLHLLLDLPKLDRGGLDVLGDWLNEHSEVRLVTIDTLQKIKPSKKSGSTDLYSEDYDFTGLLQQFALKRGLALICVHHTRKSEAEYLLDELSGTTGISAGADCILMLKQRLDGHILYRTGRDVEEGEFAVRRDDSVGGWELLGDAKEFALSEQRRAIIEILRGGESMTPKEIAEALQKNHSTVRVLLYKMLKNREVEKKNNKYVLSVNSVNTVNSVNGINTVNNSNEATQNNSQETSPGKASDPLFTLFTPPVTTVNSTPPNQEKTSSNSVYAVYTVYGPDTKMKKEEEMNHKKIGKCNTDAGNPPQDVVNSEIKKTVYAENTVNAKTPVNTVNKTDESLTLKLNEYLQLCPENFRLVLTEKLKVGSILLSRATEAARRMAAKDTQGALALIDRLLQGGN